MAVVPDTVVLDVRGVQWASEKARVEAILGRRPGVLSVEANPVAQNATIRFDGSQTSVDALRDWVRDCGYHCAGQSVPKITLSMPTVSINIRRAASLWVRQS